MLALPPTGAAAQSDLDAHCDGPREMSFASMAAATAASRRRSEPWITGSLTAAAVDVTKMGPPATTG